MTSRARLAVLLVCLAAAAAGLAHGRSSVFSPGGSASASTRNGCPPHAPPLTTVGLRQLEALRFSLLAVVGPLSRRRYAAGTVSPEVAWTDNSPQTLSSSREAGGRWPGSYEMRVWVGNRDDIAADVFMFATRRQAGAFFAEASDPRCHQAGAASSAARPPHGRNLVWTNPDGPTQQDLFLLRGTRVYRVSDVRGRRTHPRSPSVERTIGLQIVNKLACALLEAGCYLLGNPAFSQARAISRTAPLTRSRSSAPIT